MLNDGMTRDIEKLYQMSRLLTNMGPPVVALMDPKPGERILDIGCGSGELDEGMVRMGCDVLGIDVSSTAVASAQSLGVPARVMNAESMTFKNEFDAVFSNGSLHWMRHTNRVVAGVVRALKKGGRFVGETGERKNLRTVIEAVTQALDRRGIEVENLHPWVFLTKDELSSILEQNGLVIKSMEVIDRPTVLPGTIAEWLSVFGLNYLSSLYPQERDAFLAEVTELCQPRLLKPDGTCFLDYVRLRFYAVKA